MSGYKYRTPLEHSTLKDIKATTFPVMPLGGTILRIRLKPISGSILLLVLALTVVSCSITKHKETAERAVAKFHQHLNAEEYAEIYKESDKLFKENVSEADGTALFGAVHAKLGNVKNATPQGWNVNATSNGTIVRLQYDVDFTEGKGTEQFGFLINGNEALLVRYDINSPLLITK